MNHVLLDYNTIIDNSYEIERIKEYMEEFNK